MRNDKTRTSSDWAVPNLLADDPLIAGNIAARICRADADNDNFPRPEMSWPAGANDFEESKLQNTTAFDRECRDPSLVLVGIFISYFAAAMLLLVVV